MAVRRVAAIIAGQQAHLRGATQMQFELSTRQLDAAEIATALRPLDPAARVAFDAEHGHLEVLSSASAEQVLGVLDAMGCVATPLSTEVHISGGKLGRAAGRAGVCRSVSISG